ncbi:MAG: ATP-binding protein [Polyangiales bacterium]
MAQPLVTGNQPEVDRGLPDAPSFDDLRRRTNIQGLRAASVVAFVVVSSFAVVEYYVVPEHFSLLQGFRAICLLVLAVVAVLAFRDEAWTRHHVDALTVGAFLICGWYSIILMSLHQGYHSDFFLTLVFIIVGVGAVTLWPLKTAVLYVVLIFASFLVPLLFGVVDLKSRNAFIIHLGFLFGMAIISVVAQQLRYRIQQREFETNRSLELTKVSLEYAYEQLKTLDQLKTDFFANVSHELRTPLTLSLGPLESLLKKEHPPDEEQHLQALHRNQLRLLRVINQLLDLAKIESGAMQAEFSKEDVVELVSDIVGEVEDAAQTKGLKIVMAAPPGPRWLYIDREKFEQVILNLLSNAFKFTNPGGRIVVSVSEAEESTEILVSDTGVGIPENKLWMIFDRFAQADTSETRQYPGTGIGLALVQSYVELHGGTIDVKSELGEGTTFRVSMPTGKAHLPPGHVQDSPRGARARGSEAPRRAAFRFELEEASEREPPPDPAPQGTADFGSAVEESDWLPTPLDLGGAKARVLVVDDTPDMRRYLSSLLSVDYDVRTARDGADGLRQTREWDPDLVVSDIMMPVMSGADMCKAIKRGGGRLSRTPVVLVTARAGEETKLRGLDYGADDYLLKPFLQDELLLRVRNLVIKRRQERALFDTHLRLRAQHQHLMSDIELARDFQTGLLSKFEMPAGLTAHVEFRPADVVGGDFYHLTSLGPSRVRLLVADMVDHGVKAAVRAAAAWPEYTALDHGNLDPAKVLQRLNEVATSKYDDLSGSFLCMDLDAAAHDRVSVRYSQAGEMPFTIVSGGGLTTPPAAEGFMIGLFRGMSYQLRELTVTPGTRLFLYSDGLYTQHDEAGQTFRGEALKEAWEKTMQCKGIRAATEGVLGAFDAFRDRTSQLDDVTLIGIEVGS